MHDYIYTYIYVMEYNIYLYNGMCTYFVVIEENVLYTFRKTER